jgi:hypothetical protein
MLALPLVNGRNYGSGWRFNTDYVLLEGERKIHRDLFVEHFGDRVRTGVPPHFPFCGNGNVRQGYFFPFDGEGFEFIVGIGHVAEEIEHAWGINIPG